MLWGHYAHKPEGVCLGFEIPDSSVTLMKYEQERLRIQWRRGEPVIDEVVMWQILTTKFWDWRYEEEIRLFTTLDLNTDEHAYQDFSDNMQLKQVIVGACSTITRQEISEALGDLNNQVATFKARPAFRKFKIVRNRNENLWK